MQFDWFFEYIGTDFWSQKCALKNLILWLRLNLNVVVMKGEKEYNDNFLRLDFFLRSAVACDVSGKSRKRRNSLA